MVPEGTNSQDPPSGSDEPILERIERAHRQIVNSIPTELAAAQEPGRIKEEMSAFMALVRSHERTETRLVADTYYLEEGGSG